VAEYYLVRRWRGQLDESRVRGELPATEPELVPATLVIWAASAVFGWWSDQAGVGVGSLNSLLLAGLLYFVIGKLGWLRHTREVPVHTGEEDAACESAST